MVLYWVYRMIVIILGDMAINIAWLVLSNVRHFRFQMLGMSLIIWGVTRESRGFLGLPKNVIPPNGYNDGKSIKKGNILLDTPMAHVRNGV